MSGQAVSLVSMCKHRKTPRRAISCTDVGADQGLRLSVNRSGVGEGLTGRASFSSPKVNTFQCQNRCELKAKHSNPRASGHCPRERPGALGHWGSSVWWGRPLLRPPDLHNEPVDFPCLDRVSITPVGGCSLLDLHSQLFPEGASVLSLVVLQGA